MLVFSSLSSSVVYQGSLEQLLLAFATSVLRKKANSLRLMIKLQRLTGQMMLSFPTLAQEINQGYTLVAICVALSVQRMLLYTGLTWSGRIHHPLIWPLYNCNRRVPFSPHGCENPATVFNPQSETRYQGSPVSSVTPTCRTFLVHLAEIAIKRIFLWASSRW